MRHLFDKDKIKYNNVTLTASYISCLLMLLNILAFEETIVVQILNIEIRSNVIVPEAFSPDTCQRNHQNE